MLRINQVQVRIGDGRFAIMTGFPQRAQRPVAGGVEVEGGLRVLQMHFAGNDVGAEHDTTGVTAQEGVHVGDGVAVS